ncbi:MAG: TonB-dependent receptor [Steroidobacteraceae bacterium]
MHRSCIFFLVAMAAAESSAASDAAPPDALQEVVVTATLRPVAAVELPASVTVLDEAALRAAGVQHWQDVLPLVPNLNWASGSSRPRYFQLRGIGETDQWQGAPNPSVGFLIDGMDFSGIGMPATLLDLGQAEVLRGPQGTTLGANALAGLISLSTRRAELEPELALHATGGTEDTRSLGVVAGGALAESSDTAWRAVMQRYRSDGSRRNLTLDRDDTNGFDETTLRARLGTRFGARWRADLSALWVNMDNGFDAFAIDNSRLTRSDDPGRDAQRSRGASATLVRSGEGIEFRSVTALVAADITYSFDGDWGAAPDYDFTSRFLRQRDSVSQDLRWLSSATEGGWSWLAGLYGLRLAERNDQLDLYGGEVYRALVSDYRSDTVAAYGQVTHEWSEAWSLSTGLRLERRSARYRDTDGSNLSPGESMYGGNVSLQYRWRTDQMAYLSVARGYKGGGFNIGAAIPEARRGYAPELLHSVEIGLKGRDAMRRIDYSAALFYMQRSEQQVSTSAQLDPGDPLSFIYLTDNAARGVNWGLEASAALRPARHWSISGTLGILETRFVDYVVGNRSLNGREQAHAPQYQLSATVEYRRPQGWFARADLQRVAGFFFSDSHDQRSQPYTLLNLRAGYATPRWSVDVWVRNALDEQYSQRGFFFGNEPPDFPDKLYVQQADPRVAGITVSWALR